MPESPHSTGPDSGTTTRRAIRWDALAAVIASLVGLLALIVAGYTAYIERQQVRAQVWPHLHVGQSTFPPSIYVVNQGVGPAIVRSVEILVDGKPQPDWEHVFAAVGMHGDINTQGPRIRGYVLTPGREANWLDFGFTRNQYQSLMDALKAGAAGNARQAAAAPEAGYAVFEGRQRMLFRQFLDGAKRSRLQVRICYCSTLGDCKLALWNANQDPRADRGGQCMRVPESAQFME